MESRTTMDTSESGPSSQESSFRRKLNIFIVVYQKLLSLKPVPLDKVRKKLNQIEEIFAEEMSKRDVGAGLVDELTNLQQQYEKAIRLSMAESGKTESATMDIVSKQANFTSSSSSFS